MSDVLDQAYRYLRPSTAGPAGVLLATSGGTAAPNPYLFDGFVDRPEQTATALITVARIARTRFWTPPGGAAARSTAADPVVTSDGERLRLESFSVCGGVHARLDLLPSGLDGREVGAGTASVNVNAPMREALATIRDGEPLHLAVGADPLTASSGGCVEKQVPLSERWLRGFAEAQLAAAGLHLVHSLTAGEARRFLEATPRGSGLLWAVPGVRGLRLMARATSTAVGVAGAERLRVLLPVLRFSKALLVYGPRRGGPVSGWQLDLPGARLTIVLSPDVSRGFPDGGALSELAGESVAQDARALFTAELDPAAAGLDGVRAGRALRHLAAAGRAGYDLAELGYFARELPYDPAVLAALDPCARAAELAPGGEGSV